MPSDITLAVEDGLRRMTYAEIADVRRISVESAERLVRRRKWSRQAGNDGVVRVNVPLSEARPAMRRQGAADMSDGQSGLTSDGQSGLTSADDRRTFERVFEVLSAQLEHERGRADRAEQRSDSDRARADVLQARLEVGQLAEQLARVEAAGLGKALGEARAELDARREWGLGRRLRWALGRKR